MNGFTGNSIVYDAENRLLGAGRTGAGAFAYSYDGNGRRVSKTSSANTTVYVYDAQGELAAEYNSAGWAAPPCTTCYLSYDHLGSVRMVTDSGGNVISRHDFFPFGEEITSSSLRPASLGFAGTDEVSQRFTGKERDSESGLDYFGARYCGGALGRFASPDTTGYSGLTNPQSWNLYAYTLNNPLRYVDLSGHKVENVCANQQACTAAVAASTGNAEAATRVSSNTTVTHHNFLGIKWDTSVTNITISGDIGSFRALSANANKLADLVTSSKNFTVDIREGGYFTNDRQGAFGTGFLSTQFPFAGGVTQTPSMTGNDDGNVYIKSNPAPDDLANEAGIEGIPGANQGEAMAHELEGHLWGEVFGGHKAGTSANKQDAVDAENAVRATDPTRKQKQTHDHYH